jgi:hypothetical protein
MNFGAKIGIKWGVGTGKSEILPDPPERGGGKLEMKSANAPKTPLFKKLVEKKRTSVHGNRAVGLDALFLKSNSANH